MYSLSSLRSDSSTPSSFPSISEESLEVPQPWFLTDVEVLEDQLRGTGSYGTVHEALWQGSKVAVKKLHEVFFEDSVTPEYKRGILKTFARELNILFLLRHPNIVPFFGVYKPSGGHPPGHLSGHELSSDTYLVQELMCTALDVRNRSKPRLNLRNVIDIALGITSGLCYLHERPEPIIHRDLATKNVLLSYSGIPKIADLGVAGIMESGRNTPQTRQPGTELYMPHEVKVEGVVYNTKVDVFSFGVVVLELCIGRDPTASEAFRMSSSGMLTIVPEIERRKKDFLELGEHFLKSLIVQCLSLQDRRPTAKGIVKYLLDMQRSAEYQSTSESPIVSGATAGPTLNSEPAKMLSAKCEMLEEKVAVLLGDKQHLEQKLNAYLRSDREELQSPSEDKQRVTAELHGLKAENLHLQKALAQKDLQLSQFGPPLVSGPQLRDQRATLLHRINELETSKKEAIQEHSKEIAELKTVNSTLRRQLVTNASLARVHGQPTPQSYKLPTPQVSSLPSSYGHGQPPSLDGATSELRKLKYLVDKYKMANIELDRKLKEARLELQQYEHRRKDFDVGHRLEAEELRSENRELRVQLDGALQENYRLQRDLSVLMDRSRRVY